MVVPVRAGESTVATMASLAAQTLQDFEAHIIVDSHGRGANWARNRGAGLARAPFLLFSDADITWDPDALDLLYRTLHGAEERERAQPCTYRTAYAFGGYRLARPGGIVTTHANEPWDLATLRQRNMVSTMALLRREAFLGFDESLMRLQDWELWLRMALQHRLRGEWCGRAVFATTLRPGGITSQGDASYRAAWRTIRNKLGIT